MVPTQSVKTRNFAVAAVCVFLASCTRSAPSEFPPNLEGRKPESISPRQATAIQEALTRLFGTLNEPRVPEGVGLRIELLQAAAGPAAGDAQGNQRGLFRRYCVACHGLAGHGAGPAAAVLDPYPRDFRSGIFKYTSTRAGAKPTREDLRRTLYRGLPGAAMPSFVHLRAEETEALLEYVVYLSIRGETELYLLQWIVDADGSLPPDMEQVIDEGVLPAAQSWLGPERSPWQSVVVPPPRPAAAPPELLAASVAKGKELFLSKNAQCAKCHGEQGDGNGEEKELYDDWNKRKKGVTPEQTAQLARLFTLPIQRLRARNFREGVFRGGAEPEEIYQRICVGIKGTPMPAAGPDLRSEGALKADEIWHVVDYVRSLGAGRGK